MNGRTHYKMKYDFDLTLDEETSIGKIFSHIEDNSTVLEFGPGNGRMTKYLVEGKNCNVSIVEFDEELYKVVMEFAHDGFLGNIEEYLWQEYFENRKFDYIIFADVLEHLSNPEKTLEKVIPFLEKEGKILISFPNLAHNSVLIDLFNNKLDWNQYGLLDATHNTFYTQSGFNELFNRIGLYIEVEDYTYSQVGQNEIKSKYEDLPSAVQYDFKTRLFGEVYQYFYVLTKEPVEDIIRYTPQNSHFVKHVTIEYLYDQNTERELLLLNNYTGENKKSIIKVPENVIGIKIFPSNQGSILKFRGLTNGKELRELETNALWKNDGTYFFENDKGFFSINRKNLIDNQLELDFDYIYEGQHTEIQKKIASYSAKQKLEVEKLQARILEIEQSHNNKVQLMTQRYNEVIKFSHKNGWLTNSETSRSERNRLITITIESIENDEELDCAIVKGWGFSNVSKEPLRYRLQSNEGAYFKVTPIMRHDVTDIYELDEQKKYGFILEIENYQINKTIHLTAVTSNDEQVFMKVDRFNLSNAGVFSRARYLLGNIRSQGLLQVLRRYKNRHNQQSLYEKWILQNEQFDVEIAKHEISNLSYQPKISIVIPVYNVEEKWLRVCIESLKNQWYNNWELCIADDASTELYIRPFLEELMKQDQRIKVIFREKNGHISEATNSALNISTGEYVGFMDNDDELAPNALFEVVKALNMDRNIDFLYTDEDKIDIRGRRFDPFFKPNWNSELLLGHNYITHFVVVKKDLVINHIGGLRAEYNGSQDYDFVLRATEFANKIYHIPKILYHWRTVETSVAFDPQSKEYAYLAGKRALESALIRRGISGTVQMTKNYGAYKINYRFNVKPKVSIIFNNSTNDKREVLKRFLDKTYYNNVEFLIPNSEKGKTNFSDDRIVYVDGETVNEQANYANGEYLVFVNSSLEPKNSEWLNELMNIGQREEVGIVCGKIINPFETILNVGIVLDEENSSIDYEQRGVSNKSIGYYFRPTLPRELYATTEDCILISKSDFEKVCGFDETLTCQLIGIDLSLKVSKLPKKIIFNPYAEMVAISELQCLEGKGNAKKIIEKWTLSEMHDNYKNPNSLS